LIEGGNGMARKLLGSCPVCSSELKVTELSCDHCETKISGNFKLDKFNYLTDEEKYFIEIFVKNRGNIKEIEKDLGISYPTVRRNLDNVIKALGYSPEGDEKAVNKNDVLEKLSQGEISSDEALKLLKK